MGNFAENLNLGNRFRPLLQKFRGPGKARFNVATYATGAASTTRYVHNPLSKITVAMSTSRYPST